MAFVSRVGWVAFCILGGCIATDPIDFDAEENIPPSLSSQAEARFPMSAIGSLNLDDPAPTQEMPLETVVVDANVEQTLQYRVFLDSEQPPSPNEVPILDGFVSPSGFLDRDQTFLIPYARLVPGICHKIEVVITSEFRSPIDSRTPAEPGDVFQATWWVEVVDADAPTADRCR